MNITRRSDYACRILRAAFLSDKSHMSVAEIAEVEDIPYSFARSIQNDLTKAGLIKTVRGAQGGLVLNCDPEKVTLLEVLEILQGPVSVAICTVDPCFCDKSSGCGFHSVWHGADKLLNEYFASITLAELLNKGAKHPTLLELLGPEGVYDKWTKPEDETEEVEVS